MSSEAMAEAPLNWGTEGVEGPLLATGTAQAEQYLLPSWFSSVSQCTFKLNQHASRLTIALILAHNNVQTIFKAHPVGQTRDLHTTPAVTINN
jgi:hypothetical protein